MVKGHCICHSTAQQRDSFRDEASWREFNLSGLCQKTQDSIFDCPEDEPSVEIDLQEAYRRNPLRE